MWFAITIGLATGIFLGLLTIAFAEVYRRYEDHTSADD